MICRLAVEQNINGGLLQSIRFFVLAAANALTTNTLTTIGYGKVAPDAVTIDGAIVANALTRLLDFNRRSVNVDKRSGISD